MRQQFLKRLLILLPAVWFIASVVFLLGKLMPGSAPEIAYQQALENSGSNIKAEIRQKAFMQIRQRAGMDLPVFYVGFGTAAEPDTFYRIFPETDRIALQRLTHVSGNWPAVAGFYKDIQQLRSLSTNFPAVNKIVQAEIEILLSVNAARQRTQIFKKLKIATARIADKELLKTV